MLRERCVDAEHRLTAPPDATATAAAAICEETTDPGDVAVSIKDFAFDPSAISAKVGQVIAFSNTGTVQHTATVDDGSCSTPKIDAGSVDGLAFSVAGSYPFHCAIHAQMTGTITVTE